MRTHTTKSSHLRRKQTSRSFRFTVLKILSLLELRVLNPRSKSTKQSRTSPHCWCLFSSHTERTLGFCSRSAGGSYLWWLLLPPSGKWLPGWATEPSAPHQRCPAPSWLPAAWWTAERLAACPRAGGEKIRSNWTDCWGGWGGERLQQQASNFSFTPHRAEHDWQQIKAQTLTANQNPSWQCF